jgi:hypothetical protein
MTDAQIARRVAAASKAMLHQLLNDGDTRLSVAALNEMIKRTR